MKIYDISMLIHKDMPVYKNKEEKKPRVTVTANYEVNSYYETRIELDTHTGTHLDAPLHMIEGGDTIENIDLYKCITPCKVFDLTSAQEKITDKDIKDLDIQEGDFVIFKTKDSFKDEFDENFVFLERTGAEYLRDKKIKGIGMDVLGIERAQPNHESHKAILGNDITILEGLRLKDIQEGKYLLCALPLKVKGTEGAPARAVLIDNINF